MSYNNKGTNNFLIGAILGGILGGASGLLFAPKKGEDLRDDIADKYNQINDFTRSLSNKACKIAHMNGYHKDNENTATKFILGTIAGTLIGATSAFLLAPKSGSKFRKDISNTYNDIAEQTQHFANQLGKKTRGLARNIDSYSNEWKDLASELMEKVSGTMSPRNRGNLREKAEDIMDWVNIGYRAWQNIQKRR